MKKSKLLVTSIAISLILTGCGNNEEAKEIEEPVKEVVAADEKVEETEDKKEEESKEETTDVATTENEPEKSMGIYSREDVHQTAIDRLGLISAEKSERYDDLVVGGEYYYGVKTKMLIDEEEIEVDYYIGSDSLNVLDGRTIPISNLIHLGDETRGGTVKNPNADNYKVNKGSASDKFVESDEDKEADNNN